MNGWYSFSFKVNWPPNGEPKWWVDIFIADCIVRKIVSNEELKIPLWRIHRRAYRESGGHEFTFECSTDKNTSKSIDESVRSNPAYKILERERLIEKYDLGKSPKDLPDGVPETGWPDELQNAWAYYIHGVCAMFVGLIEQVKAKTSGFPDVNGCGPDISQIEGAYNKLHDELTQVWRRCGQSAFLHHLNAIFAYAPIRVQLPLEFETSFPNVLWPVR